VYNKKELIQRLTPRRLLRNICTTSDWTYTRRQSVIAPSVWMALLPLCYRAPSEFRERRRTLRYRNLLVRQNVQMKNLLSQNQ
jgi:hypothetical protein